MAKSKEMKKIAPRRVGRTEEVSLPEVDQLDEVTLPPATVLLVQLDPQKVALLHGLLRLGLVTVECSVEKLRMELQKFKPRDVIVIVGYYDQGPVNGNLCVKMLQDEAGSPFFTRVLRIGDQDDPQGRRRHDFYYRPVVNANLPAVVKAMGEILLPNDVD